MDWKLIMDTFWAVDVFGEIADYFDLIAIKLSGRTE